MELPPGIADLDRELWNGYWRLVDRTGRNPARNLNDNDAAEWKILRSSPGTWIPTKAELPGVTCVSAGNARRLLLLLERLETCAGIEEYRHTDVNEYRLSECDAFHISGANVNLGRRTVSAALVGGPAVFTHNEFRFLQIVANNPGSTDAQIGAALWEGQPVSEMRTMVTHRLGQVNGKFREAELPIRINRRADRSWLAVGNQLLEGISRPRDEAKPDHDSSGHPDIGLLQ